MQNSDGGWPTFCTGRGRLPFDRSGTDLTAHALRAQNRWLNDLPEVPHGFWQIDIEPRELQVRWFIDWGNKPALKYLARNQYPDGSWLPLWFGCQYAPDDENPTYGTARVLAAYRDLNSMDTEPARRGVRWLLSAQNADGGWGGAVNTPSSIEETALAVEVLLSAGPEAVTAVNNGLAWLVQRIESGGLTEPTPIGFYFAKLWYFEKLYPIIFSVAALGRARKAASPPDSPTQKA
jgi:squalene-hopene/tetraprenyl-beta-curcumene cyclase